MQKLELVFFQSEAGEVYTKRSLGYILYGPSLPQAFQTTRLTAKVPGAQVAPIHTK